MDIMCRTCFVSVFCLLVSGVLSFCGEDALSAKVAPPPKKEVGEIVVHNRILACIAGHPISVFDVMKRMDFMFYRQYPEYAGSLEARMEFYKMAWRNVFEELIDRALVLDDAKTLKVEIPPNEVRQDLEKLFGPNVVMNLASIDMSLDEAMKQIETDLLIKRTTSYRVNVKAFREIHPQQIRGAYEVYCKDHFTEEKWEYAVVTVQGGSSEEAVSKVANEVYALLQNGNTSLEEAKKLYSKNTGTDKIDVIFKFPIENLPQDIGKNYLDELSLLKEGEVSQPVAQKSRSRKGSVYRIFVLLKVHPKSYPSLKSVEMDIKNDLLKKNIEKESRAYFLELRQRYKVDMKNIVENIPSDFVPFSLRKS